MSKKTKRLKEKIDILRSDINYHKSNVRLLLNNPTRIQIEELKFQYPQYDQIIMAGRKPDANKTDPGMYGDLAGKEYKFPKEELESREYHVSKHAPVNVVDDKKFYGVVDGEPTEKNYLSEKEIIFDLPVGVEGWRSFIIGGILIHAPNDKSPEDWTRVIETLKNLPVCTPNKEEKPNKFIVDKDVKLGDNYIGDVKFQKSELLDKSWNDFKKESAKNVGDQLAKQTDVNNDAENLTKKQIEKYDDFFKSHTGYAIEAGTHKAPDEYVLVKVKVGSVIIDPDFKSTVVGSSGIRDHVGVGDLKKRADAMEKCTDQECKPIKQEYEKTLENVEKIDRFIGLKDASSISHGNKDVIFKKSAEWDSINGAKMFFYNVGNPYLKYTPEQMLNDWKSGFIKPFD